MLTCQVCKKFKVSEKKKNEGPYDFSSVKLSVLLSVKVAKAMGSPILMSKEVILCDKCAGPLLTAYGYKAKPAPKKSAKKQALPSYAKGAKRK